tara:strand:+ start:349 stop:1482 length:1134 start_codon:yes stop_codon:yes gene_type:complete
MPINEQTLESFLSGNLSVLDEIIGTDASELKNILNSATISGMQTSEILNQVSVASSASGQRAILNTRLNTYSRVATNTMMKDAPADTKYVYVGPIDDRTRDECLDYASAGPLTEAQIIESGWAASLVDGGGINCRHKWEIASDEGIKLFEGKQAQQVIQNKQGNINLLSMAGKHSRLKDATKWAETNVAKKVDFSKTDVGVANLINKQLKELQSKGIVIDEILPTRKSKELFSVSAKYLTIGGTETSIVQSIKFKYGINNAGNKKRLNDSIRRLNEKGIIKNGTVESIMTHEYGHILDYINPIDTLTSPSNALNKLLSDKFKLNKLEILTKQSQISGTYILTNAEEQFAEMYRLWKENKLIEEFEFVGDFFNSLRGS